LAELFADWGGRFGAKCWSAHKATPIAAVARIKKISLVVLLINKIDARDESETAAAHQVAEPLKQIWGESSESENQSTICFASNEGVTERVQVGFGCLFRFWTTVGSIGAAR
jgi:hypothetical protein